MKLYAFLLATLMVCMALAGIASASAAEEEVVIKMAIFSGSPEMYEIAENYKAVKPNVTIEFEEYPSAEYLGLYKAKLAGGECWDVLPVIMYLTPPLVEGGHLADLNSIDYILDRYKDRDTIANSRTYDGVLVSLPAQFQYVFLFYNKAMFAEMGLSIPADYQQLLEMIETAKSAGVTPIAAGFKENWVNLHTVTAFAAANVQRDDLDWGVKRRAGEVSFAETPGWATTIDKVRTLIEVGAFGESAVSTSDEQAMMMFLNGDALCYLNATWGVNALTSAQPEGFELGGFRIPTHDAGEIPTTAVSITGDFAVWAKSEVKEEAIEWLAYTLSAEQNQVFNAKRGPSPFKDVEIDLLPALVEFEETLAASGGKTALWCNHQQMWPDGAPYPDPLFPTIQELFYPELAKSTADILKSFDDAWDDATAG